MENDFNEVVFRLQDHFREIDEEQREELLNQMWSLVPKAEQHKAQSRRRTTTGKIDCPCCGRQLTIQLQCQ